MIVILLFASPVDYINHRTRIPDRLLILAGSNHRLYQVLAHIEIILRVVTHRIVFQYQFTPFHRHTFHILGRTVYLGTCPIDLISREQFSFLGHIQHIQRLVRVRQDSLPDLPDCQQTIRYIIISRCAMHLLNVLTR